MKNLIYYPTFEPTDRNWLKYALIYIEKFTPIIPQTAYSELSNEYKAIIEETDLVHIHEPKWWQGDHASTKALKEIAFIEKNPEQYRDKLKSVNINRVWKNPENWNFEIYDEKFNFPFKDRCIEMGLGKPTKKGLMTSKELAQVFMTFLVNEVAYETGLSPITDSNEYDNLSTYLRAKNLRQEDIVQSAKTVIDLNLPNNIESIPIDKFIEFRNNTEINELRKTFNSSLNKFYESIEEDFDSSKYVKSLEELNKQLVKEIVLFFGGVSTAFLGGLILIEDFSRIKLLKEIIQGSIIGITGGSALRKSWGVTEEKRNARKFLTKINQI